MFDEATIQKLKYYVYVLLDPEENPFYIGKGFGNRVFSHATASLLETALSDKLDTIKKILQSGRKIKHVIIRHGLDEDTAYIVESSLIDLLTLMKHPITNSVMGHYSLENGLMNTDEIIRRYNAVPLEEIGNDVVIININRTYKRGSGQHGIYEATRGSWVINKERLPNIKVALSEYRGFIVAVFLITEWVAAINSADNANSKVRWNFVGEIATGDVHDRYFNKSVAHIKRRGAANPIRYRL